MYLRVPPVHHALAMDLDLEFLIVYGATHVLLDMFMYKNFSGFCRFVPPQVHESSIVEILPRMMTVFVAAVTNSPNYS